MKRPPALEELSEALSRLPGIGAVTSERLAYHLLSVPKPEALALAEAIVRCREEIRLCSLCGNLDQVDPCGFCTDDERDQGLVLVVEGPREVISFEAAGFRGLYHVLHGRVAPLEGIQEKDLEVQKLIDRVTKSSFREICLATSPDLEGEATADLLRQALDGSKTKITRIARGIPAGASITQVQKSILADALEGRRHMA
jgi:recombination protein RecR